MSRRRGLNAVGAAGFMVAAAAGLAGCSYTPSGPYLCTDIYAYLTAVTVDARGTPVSGLAVRDSVPRTHAAFDETQLGLGPTNQVVIFSDGDQQRVSRTQHEPVIVTGTGAAGSFRADYVFDATGCHVLKVSGPDTLVVQ